MPQVVSILPPFEVFADVDGEPLESGYIYIGQAGLNPLVENNRVAIYSDSALSIPVAQPVRTIGGYPVVSGSPTRLYVGAADYSILVTNKDGTLVYSSLNNVLALGLVNSSDIIYPINATEQGAGLTDADLVLSYYYGDVRRYKVVGDGATDNTVNIQKALNGNAGAFPVIFPKGVSYYRLISRVTAPANTHIILQDGPELRWTATTATGSPFLGGATRPGIEAIGNNFLLEGMGTLRGPTVGAYVANEIGIWMTGTTALIKKNKFTVRGAIEILNWGSYGINLQFVDDISIEGDQTHVHDVGYCGIIMNSCNHGRVSKIQIGNVTPGTSGNAYGFSLSSDATNYNLDPNAGTKQAVNPFCWDWVVEGCTVYDIPLWTGLDAHGCYETHFVDNNIFNCGIGINQSSQSGAGFQYAGWDNSVVGNVVDMRRRDGTATTTTTQKAGIIVNGGSIVRNLRPTVARNKVYGAGVAPSTWNSIEATLTQDAIIVDNQIESWTGFGIYSTGGSGVIANNTFGAVTATPSTECIRLDATLSGAWTVTNNRHRPFTGTAAPVGLTISATAPRCIVAENDFDYATLPYAGSTVLLTCGPSVPIPRMQVTGTPVTIDVATLLASDRVWLEIIANVTTVTDLVNAKVGTRYILHNTTANNFTFDRTNAALPGGVNAVLGQHDTIELLCVALAGIKFVALTGVNANS